MNSTSFKTSRWIGNEPLREIATTPRFKELQPKELNAVVYSALNLVCESTWSHNYKPEADNFLSLVQTDLGSELAKHLETISDGFFDAKTTLLELKNVKKKYPGHNVFCLLLLAEHWESEDKKQTAENICQKISYLLNFIQKQLNSNGEGASPFVFEVCKSLSQSWKKLYPFSGA